MSDRFVVVPAAYVGLLTEDRVPKVDAARIAAVNRGPAASSPGQTQEEIQIVHAARRRSSSGDPMP
ncbi:MAG TPA: hypothetical protein VEV65_08050 [Kineosporiaceae bacterium]|nr:hypothetical protein [Kineosporiaceae bacterium]